jgi:hypothetical protein
LVEILHRWRCRSRTNADDRLLADPLGRIESGDDIVEGCDVADVRPQSSVPYPLDDLTQLGASGRENKVDRQAVSVPCRLGVVGSWIWKKNSSRSRKLVWLRSNVISIASACVPWLRYVAFLTSPPE